MQHYILAHRGWSGVAPENTMSSFKLAVNDPTVDAIECDIQMTKDGELVVIHDFTLERTSNGKGLVRDYTYEELRQLDFGSWFSPRFAGEKIIRFKELLQLINGRKILFVELKVTADLYPDIAEKLLSVMQGYPKETLKIESFDHALMKRIKAMDAGLSTGLIFHDNVTLLPEQLKYTNSNFAAIYFGNITQELVDRLTAEQIEINVWTLNQKWQYDYIKKFRGRFYLTSDFPGLAKEQMSL